MRSHPQSRPIHLSGLQTCSFYKVTSAVIQNITGTVLSWLDTGIILFVRVVPHGFTSSIPACPSGLHSLFFFLMASWLPSSPLASFLSQLPGLHQSLDLLRSSSTPARGHVFPIRVCFIRLGGKATLQSLAEMFEAAPCAWYVLVFNRCSWNFHVVNKTHSSEHRLHKCYCFAKISRQYEDRTETYSFCFKIKSDQNEKKKNNSFQDLGVKSY